MIRICSHCRRVVGTRNCPYCGNERTIPQENRPEDRVPFVEAEQPMVVEMPAPHPKPPRPPRIRVVYRRGKPPLRKAA